MVLHKDLVSREERVKSLNGSGAGTDSRSSVWSSVWPRLPRLVISMGGILM